MSIFEYDEEAVMALIRSDEREDGRNEGLLQARQGPFWSSSKIWERYRNH